MFSSVKKKIQDAIRVLEASEGALDKENVVFRTNSGDREIETNAYRQIKRYQQYRLGANAVRVPHRSKTYQQKKRSLGMPADFWTLVFTGLLYGSLRFEVKSGALYVIYDDLRGDVVENLKRLSGISDIIHPTPEEAKEMALKYHRSVVDKFRSVWQRKR